MHRTIEEKYSSKLLELKEQAINAGIELLEEMFDDSGKRLPTKLYKLQCGCLKALQPGDVRRNSFACKNHKLTKAEYDKIYRETNKTRIAEYMRQYAAKNRTRLSAIKKKYEENNIEKVKSCRESWRNQNKAYYLMKCRERQLTIRNRVPSWLSDEHKLEIKEIYKLRSIISETTGIQHHVDHIVPLNGETVCGLHVPWNLQIIPASENLVKSNKFEDEYT